MGEKIFHKGRMGCAKGDEKISHSEIRCESLEEMEKIKSSFFAVLILKRNFIPEMDYKA